MSVCSKVQPGVMSAVKHTAGETCLSSLAEGWIGVSLTIVKLYRSWPSSMAKAWWIDLSFYHAPKTLGTFMTLEYLLRYKVEHR